MHVLFWGLGFLLFPDFLNVVASTGTLLLNSSTGNVCHSDKPVMELVSDKKVENEWVVN